SVLLCVPPPSQFYSLSLLDALPIFGLVPCSNAAASVIGLNAEPVCWAELASTTCVSSHSVFCATATSSPVPGRTTASPALYSLRSEEHTSELQSRENLVCRLLLEKK